MGELSLFRAMFLILSHFYFTKNVAKEVHVVTPIAGNREVFKCNHPIALVLVLLSLVFLLAFTFAPH